MLKGFKEYFDFCFSFSGHVISCCFVLYSGFLQDCCQIFGLDGLCFRYVGWMGALRFVQFHLLSV